MTLIFQVFVCLLFAKLFVFQSFTENNSKFKCGISKVKSEDDYKALDGSWPWAVSLIDRRGRIYSPGTLISAFYVITSKALLEKFSPIYVIGSGGSFKPDLLINKVVKIILHSNLDNDLAILELDKPVQFSDHILPICLPSNDYSKIFGQNLTLTGWVKLEEDNPSGQLLETRVKVLNQSECDSDSNLYCTVDIAHDICFYNFGSGLYYLENKVWYLFGVSKNATDFLLCNNTASNKVYHTMIPKFIDWIVSNLQRTEPDPDIPAINLPDDFCGKPSLQPIVRVVNGIPSISYSWPWTVALWGQMVGELLYQCGGSILSRRFIITAAHCVADKAKRYFISAGTRKLTYAENLKNMFLVKRVISNNHDGITVNNDIALLELVKPIKFNRRVSRICLPPSSNVTEVFNQTLYVAGWGSTNIVPISNEQLQTKLKVINFNNNTTCKSRDWFEYCTINQMENSNVCHGDSGSGLVYYKDKRWHIYGLVSHAVTNLDICDITKPSYHTMVPKY